MCLPIIMGMYIKRKKKEKNIIEISEELQLAEKHIEQNVNGKMVFFDLALKLTVLLKKGITS